MPITPLKSSLRRSLLSAAAAIALASPLAAAPGVAVLKSAPWSPGDTVREGAGEFEVLVSAAQLRRDHALAGVVGIGNRHGLFLQGAERALQHLALSGMPIVKLTTGGDLASDPSGLFIGAHGLRTEEARALLARCLERHGAPPAAANPASPTAGELAAIRKHLRPFRDAFVLAGAPAVASR
jgi:hypothetical protein